MVNYLDSRRIAGTTAERSSVPIPATQGGWVELARTTLGSNGDTITVSSLPNKRYYMILTDVRPTASVNTYMRLGSGGTLDTGSNYSDRTQYQGGSDVTYTSSSYYNAYSGGGNEPSFWVQYLANYASKEKLSIMHGNYQSSAGAATAPVRFEVASKWANTSNAIDVFQLNNTAGGSRIGSGSEVVVLGWDESDTHTNNFWQELASVELSGGATSSIDSGTFTAKKYLWWQFFTDGSSSNSRIDGTFNSDTTTYATRGSELGGSDSTYTSQSYFKMSNGVYNSSTPIFVNGFAINNSANEKLVITHTSSSGSATGAGNAPYRTESVSKYDNTSAQITSIQINTSAGNWGTGTLLKVWGAD